MPRKALETRGLATGALSLEACGMGRRGARGTAAPQAGWVPQKAGCQGAGVRFAICQPRARHPAGGSPGADTAAVPGA